jgi:pimeloyl-ACP methyl ester carboxylesterase
MTTRPTLLLLPGNMCDARLWRGIDSSLQGWSVVRPLLDKDDSIAGMAQRVLAETGGPVIPVGFSMGGITALMIAALAPERIAGLALLDTNASADLPERAAVRPAQQQAAQGGALESIVTDQLMPNYLAAENEGDAGLRALILDMALGLGADVFVRQSEALRTRPDQRTIVAKIDKPLFLACGREDRLCPPEWHERMAAEAADAELHVIEGAGHMLPLEQPDRLATALKAWLSHIRIGEMAS